jgi:hypothetical protein
MLCVSVYVGDAVTNNSLRLSEIVTEIYISPQERARPEQKSQNIP